MLRHPMGAHEPEIVTTTPETADGCEHEDRDNQRRPDSNPDHVPGLREAPSVPRLRSLRIVTDADSSGDCIQLDASESTQIFKICTRVACLLSCVTVLSHVFRC